MYDYFLYSLYIYSLYITRRKWHANFCDFLRVMTTRIPPINYENHILLSSLLIWLLREQLCYSYVILIHVTLWCYVITSFVITNKCVIAKSELLWNAAYYFNKLIFTFFQKLFLASPLRILSLSSQVCHTTIKMW